MAPVTMPETAVDLATVSDGPPTELIDGEIVEMQPMGVYPVEIASMIHSSLDVFVRANGIGRSLSEALFRIDDANSYRPDVAFVSFGKWAKKLKTPNKEPWAVVPDLVVEVVSEHDKAWAVLAKVHRYFEIGARQAWLVYPSLEVIHVFRSSTEIRVLTRVDEYDGGELIPGYKLSLESLFEGEEPAEMPDA